MSILQLFIIVAAAYLIGQLKRGRSLALLGVSAFFIYWLQPPQEQVSLTFWLPTATLAITCLVWLLTSSPEVRGGRQNAPAVLVLAGVAVLINLNRYFQLDAIFITQTPRFQWLAILIVTLLVLGLAVARLRRFPSLLFPLAALGIIFLFLLVKVPALPGILWDGIATLRGKESGGFSPIAWLGFSYVAFRLLHTVLDRNAGRLPAVPLGDYVNYVIFFPAFTAGPIDRIERFVQDLDHPVPLDREGWVEAGTRFFVGLFKKFVIADSLAWIALNDVFAGQVQAPVWMWVLLYSYSLRIYFDFSGYTDIAIGIARLLGVRLPENFASPYFKPNLSQFWSSWHMTLTQWFRSYFFNPLVRGLRSSDQPLPPMLVILIAQLVTMVLIGLWHGITAGFVLWGLWHGAGLFIQNRWSDYMKGRMPGWGRAPLGQAILRYSGVFLTFHFVSIGWLFFSLSTPAQAWAVMAVLFGVP
ncbi:MAG TPA: MBOAT family O-acyltransferase [Anaerolineales bacterium]|nr:MBOAT family O-acyltransferase [Anaerolineales bacterium]